MTDYRWTMEYGVIGVYLMFLMVLGLVFRRMNRNTGDYFRSGSQGSWWLCGSSSYVSGVSAYTFTAAAGISFSAGWSVLLIYLSGPLINLAVYRFYAARCRQKRLTTMGEVYRERFNPATQQVYTLISLLTGFAGSGLVLYTLAIFVAAVFGFDMIVLIVVLGAVILFYSVAGGRWAVMANDFLQCLILFGMTILLSVLCLMKCGGLSGFLARAVDPELREAFRLFKPVAACDSYYSVPWTVALLLVSLVNVFGVGVTNFSVKDGREAEKAMLLNIVLSLVGSVLVFIPPFTARFFYKKEVMALSGLADPADGAYAVVSMQLLPAGMTGMMVVAMFAAAMSTMDTALNGGAGSFMLNVYPALARILHWRRRTPEELLQLSRLYVLGSGMLTVGLSILYAVSGTGPLQIVLVIGALLGLPMAVPMFWGLVWKRMPQWTPLVAMTVGFGCSLLLWGLECCGRGRFFYHEQVFWVSGITTLAVWLSVPLRKYDSARYAARVAAFYRKMNTPVDFPTEVGYSNDRVQLLILGRAALAGGLFVALLAAGGRSAAGIWCPLGVGGGIALTGAVLLYAARKMATCADGKSVLSYRQPREQQPPAAGDI